MALGTLVFPLMMLPVLQYRSLLRNEQSGSRGEQLIPQAVILVLYIITYVYFKRLPVSKVIHAYALAVTISMLLLVIINLKLKVSMHMAALGGISGLIISLIFLYQTPLQGFLLLTFLAAGLLGTARLAMGDHWRELLSGFILGFVVILITLLLV
jgi:chromate transport protein ChrA